MVSALESEEKRRAKRRARASSSLSLDDVATTNCSTFARGRRARGGRKEGDADIALQVGRKIILMRTSRDPVDVLPDISHRKAVGELCV